MALDISAGIGGLFEQVDTHVESVFVLDGKEYEIEQFRVRFEQGIDHKGQPQHEIMGGQLYITLTQTVDINIFDWAKRANKPKAGKVLFKTKSSGTVLELDFVNAHCVRLDRSINALSGTTTTLVIAPEIVSINGFTHNNQWKES